MSNRNKFLVILLVLVVISVVLRYLIGGPFAVGSPVVSVKAEPVISIDGSGFHFGPAMFTNEDHHPHGFIITNSMLMALVTLAVLGVLSSIVRATMRLNPGKFQSFVEIVHDGIYNTMGSVDRRYIGRFWPLVGTIFFYVLFSNWLALIPGVLSVGYRVPEEYLHTEGGAEARQVVPNTIARAGESDQLTPADGVLAQEGGGEGEGESDGTGDIADAEGEEHLVLVPYLRSPSADLNNTLMLGLVAFFFIEFWGFKELGLGYLRKFWPIKDFGAVGAVVGPLELLSEFVRIVSFAFRLFGNIFAGEVILLVMLFLFPLLPIPFLALEMFVGFIQAFVFAILVMAFASLATQGHGDHDEHHVVGGIDDEPAQAEVGGTLRQNPTAH